MVDLPFKSVKSVAIRGKSDCCNAKVTQDFIKFDDGITAGSVEGSLFFCTKCHCSCGIKKSFWKRILEKGVRYDEKI